MEHSCQNAVSTTRLAAAIGAIAGFEAPAAFFSGVPRINGADCRLPMSSFEELTWPLPNAAVRSDRKEAVVTCDNGCNA